MDNLLALTSSYLQKKALRHEHLVVPTLLLLSDILLNPDATTHLKGFIYDKNFHFKHIRSQKHFLKLLGLEKDTKLVNKIVGY